MRAESRTKHTAPLSDRLKIARSGSAGARGSQSHSLRGGKAHRDSKMPLLHSGHSSGLRP